MRIQQIQVFKFEELKKDIQEKVIDNLREINVDYDFCFDYLLEDFKKQLNKFGLDCDSFEYDLYRNEFNFYKLSIDDREKVINQFLTKEDKILNLLSNNDVYFDIGFSDNSISVNYETEEEKTEEEYKAIQEKAEEIEEEINEFLLNKRNEFLKILKKEYSSLLEDEAIKDTIEANEYEFKENGEQI